MKVDRGLVMRLRRKGLPRASWLDYVKRQPGLLIGGLLTLLPFVVLAIIPGVFAPFAPNVSVDSPLLGPSGHHLLGTDEIGRDILSRVVYATRNDLVISLASTMLAFFGGSLLGLLTGYIGRWVDSATMRAVDVMLSFPTIVLALFLVAVLGRGEGVEILAIALVMVPSMARLARGTSLSLRSRKYVEASRISGGSNWHILRRQLLPNALPTLLVAASVLASSSVLIAASLSYLGVGLPPPAPSWGNMLQAAFDNVYSAPYYGIAPGVCITVLSGAYIMIGQGLRSRALRGSAAFIGTDPQIGMR